MRRTLLTLALSLIAVSGVFVNRADAQQQPKTVWVITHVDFAPQPGGIGEALNLLKLYAADSRKDAGNLRFDVLQQDNRMNHLTLVEEWKTREDFEAHTRSEHTKQFREKAHAMMGSPFDERLHSVLQ
ncbi:MAG: putative quinol monooxygenase [Bryobacteraceae bacterium]